ncbi:MAG: valine--pyruvate transaminase [Verrucomicrobiales bacterium]
MNYPKSIFGENLTKPSGTTDLMNDLGEALALGAGKIHLLGGGTPAQIPAVQDIWRARMAAMIADEPDVFDAMLSNYDQPAGNPHFREAMAAFLNREFGWPVTAKNIGITNGGQTAFFMLLNRFAGRMTDDSHREILLPLVPEYIGYGDQGVGRDGLFTARKPRIEELGDRQFKYRVDFENLNTDAETTGAICVSRPTNPSSNVLTDNEIAKLSDEAKRLGVPLIIDNAYGQPFPGVIFEDVTPVWDEHIILTMSLSKLGLPGTRSGIVVAAEETIAELSSMTAIMGLANNNIGQGIVKPFIESGEVLKISHEIIEPFYRRRSAMAQELAHELLPADLPWKMHRSEGAFFIWFWFEGMKITAKELYDRLKARNVIVIPGNYFFYGLETVDDDWKHRDECIRVSFTQGEATLREGFRILGEELANAW